MNTHGAGNLEALFIMGMRVVFRQHGGALDASLDDLDRAARRGHKPVVFLLAMLLWRANRAAEHDLRAKELLAEAADDDPTLTVLTDRGVGLLHEHVLDMLWMYVWPNWHQVFPVPGPVPRAVHHCASPVQQVGWVDEGWCGKPVGHVGWNEWSNYCSEECRIRRLCESMFRIFHPHP